MRLPETPVARPDSVSFVGYPRSLLFPAREASRRPSATRVEQFKALVRGQARVSLRVQRDQDRALRVQRD